MNSKTLLKQLAETYLHHGPQKRRHDAETLLSMLEILDEDGARIYMERFVNKWQLLQGEAATTPTAMTYVRRRPMSNMEQQVTQTLIDNTPKDQPQVLVEWQSDVPSISS